MRCADALDRSGRQMVESIDDAKNIQPLLRLGELRPDAFQRFHFGEQRVEDVRPHALLLAPDAALAMRGKSY
jgi:hypothetical protein